VLLHVEVGHHEVKLTSSGRVYELGSLLVQDTAHELKSVSEKNGVAQHSTAQHGTARHSTAQHSTASATTALFFTIS